MTAKNLPSTASTLRETGSGGTGAFPDSPMGEPLTSLLRAHPETAVDYLEFRRIVGSAAAWLAAQRATEEDRRELTQAFEAMAAAHEKDDPAEEAASDAEFHLAVYRASHNVVMLHIMRGIFDMLRQDVFYNRSRLYLRPGVRDLLLRQHRAIYEAIMQGDPEGARFAAEKHVNFTRDALNEAKQADARQAVAERRFSHNGLTMDSKDM